MTVGAQLRAAREARGLSIEELAQTIRTKPRILAAIERDDIAEVPPRPFGRGFVGAYAREVGLDAERLQRDYFAQFAPPTPPPEAVVELPPPNPLLPAALVGAVTLVAIIGLSLALRPGRPAEVQPTVPAEVGTSGSSAAPPATPATPATDPAPAAEIVAPAGATTTPPPDPVPAVDNRPVTAVDNRTSGPSPDDAPALLIVVRATRRAWISARADGERVLHQILPAGQSRTLKAAEAISLRVGDAGALQWQINGRDAGSIGRSGQVLEVRVTKDNADRFR
jgi:cytoskeleton protein RodZ